MQSILVYLDDTNRCEQRLQMGVELVKSFGSVLQGIYVQTLAYGDKIPRAILDNRLALEVGADNKLMSDLIEGLSEAIEKRIEVLPVLQQKIFKWISVDGLTGEQLAQQSLYHDLIIVSSSSEPKELLDELFISHSNTAARSACPILMLPDEYIVSSVEDPPFQKPAMIWNHDKESGRTLKSSLPFLRQIGKVDLICEGEASVPSEELTELKQKVSRYLELQQVKAHWVDYSQEQSKPGNDAIVKCLDERGNDLTIVGAHDHTRISEIVVGSVMRQILKESRVPVLMSG